MAPGSWRMPTGIPRDCMLWEAYSKATVVLYIHKYNYIYLLYLYILIFKPKQCRSKRQWCEHQLPTALCLPAVEPAGTGARGCASPAQPRMQLRAGVRQGGVRSLECACPGCRRERGSPREATREGLERRGRVAVCSPPFHPCLSFPRGAVGREAQGPKRAVLRV